MLRPLRLEWDMEFVENAQQALDTLDKQPFEVVVSDMRMPGMDGAQLLAEVMRRYPQIVRIVLSGHSDKEMILRSVGPAHQYLAKPCDAETLKNTIARACALRDLLDSESLKAMVAQMKSLPSLPSLYARVVQELRSPDASLRKIGELIEQDVGMTAKLLQVVNSAFFGISRRVSSPAQAASLLGLDTIKALVISVKVFSGFEQSGIPGLQLETLWRHSMAVGAIARRISTEEGADPKVTDDAFMAGILHDAGKLVIAANLPDTFAKIVASSKENGVAPWEAERATLGATHAEIGAYLLGLWGLPDPIVEALAYHHGPRRCLSHTFSALTAVHVANALAYERYPNAEETPAPEIDKQYLAEISLSERIEVWRKRCLANTAVEL